MAPPITRVADWHGSYSMIIDVRSPSEFADDHIPGAVNLPVLDDAQRAEVGTMYKQVGTFEAKRHGAALVATNIATHLQTVLADKPRDFLPLIYCWRGGQRSGAMARIFSEIGWKVSVIEGGYKTYRKKVLDGLDALPSDLRLMILRGRTGTAKTQILRQAERLGTQVIDLEGLASHRGSLLGSEPDHNQPSQRYFESQLHAVMQNLDPQRPVFVEAESNKIGSLHIPPAFWHQMRGAPSVALSVPVAARVDFLIQDYAHIIQQPTRLDPLLDWVASRIGHAAVANWRDRLTAGDWHGFVTAVLNDHYDPAYARSAQAREYQQSGTLSANKLDEENIMKLATELGKFR